MLTLQTIPERRLLIDPCKVHLSGAPAGASIAIEATLSDRGGLVWSSRGVYTADLDGTIDTSTHASLAGTYRGVDAEGLFWSMLPMTLEEMGDVAEHLPQPQSQRRTPDFDAFDAPYDLRTKPVIVSMHARVVGDMASDHSDIVHAHHTVDFMANDIVRTEVREDGLIGTLFEPSGEGPFPATLVVTGSDGGCYEARAALLASKGVAALALAHFNYPGCPDNHHNVPLEYFSTAMRWLSARYGRGRVALQGASRGGEAVLLIASKFPDQVSGVVADVPSNMVFSGFDFSIMASVPGWLMDGEPLPYIGFENYGGVDSPLQEGALDFMHNFRGHMIDHDYDDPRWIAVENIKAPILMTSGTADAMWPSSLACARVAQRLKDKGFSFPITWLDYPGAGHTPGIPMLVKSRADRTERNEELNMTLAIGGTAQANAEAQSYCFPRMIAFLLENGG